MKRRTYLVLDHGNVTRLSRFQASRMLWRIVKEGTQGALPYGQAIGPIDFDITNMTMEEAVEAQRKLERSEAREKE